MLLMGAGQALNGEADEICRVKAIVSITDNWQGDVVGTVEETFELVVFWMELAHF